MCCGSLRQRDIACPSDCRYLASAQAHPAAATRRQQEQDKGLVSLLMEGLNQRQASLCSTLLSVVARFPSDPLLRLEDDGLIDAAAALAATCETAGRGVIYEHRPNSLVAQRLYADLKDFLAQAGLEGSRQLEQDAATILRRIAGSAARVRQVVDLGPATCVGMIGRIARSAAATGMAGAPLPGGSPEPKPSLLIRP